MQSKFIKVIVFILIVVLFDKIVAIACKQLYYKSNDHTIHRLRYTLDSTREDVLFFGSSRAQHHFIPPILDSATGLSSYNCGFGGEGLQFSLIQLNETLKRYKPKAVVLEVSPNILIDPESEQKLKILMPFSERDPLIYKSLIDTEEFERVKLLSSTYPYNSTIASLITGSFKPNKDTLAGFEPLIGVMDTTESLKSLDKIVTTSKIPGERLEVLERFITLCNQSNVELIVVVSPVFQSNRNLDVMTRQLETKCRGYNSLHFLNYSRSNEFYKNSIYFKDNLHLNYEGAKVFSQIFSRDLKKIIGFNNSPSVMSEVIEARK